MFRRFRRRSSDGESANVLIMAAHMALTSGNTAIARRALAEAMPRADPDELFFIARIYLTLGEPAAAEDCLRRAVNGGSLAAIKSLAELQAASGPRPAPADGDAVAAFLKLRHGYLQTGAAGLLQAAPEASRAALSQCPPGDPRRSAVLAESCVVLRMAYEQTHRPELLAQAIESGRMAVSETAADDSSYLPGLSHLGNALLEEFRRSGDITMLTEAAQCHQQVVRQLPPGHAELASTLGNLGNVLLLKARHSGDAASLDQAISAYRRALRAGQRGSLPYANIQVSLGQALIILAARDASLVTLDEATELLRAGTDALPPHHPALADLRAQLEQARAAARAARAGSLANAGAGGDQRGAAAISAAEQMIHAYETNGQLSLLTSAIETLRSQLADDGALDPFSRYHARHALGTALWSLFERTGDLAALDESAGLLESAAEAAGVAGELRLKSRSNLAGVLNLRARHTGSRADLERAIALARDVADRTPGNDPARPGRLGSVAGALRLLAYWTGDSGLARDAVAVQRTAIEAYEASADGVPPSAFSDLGLYLATVEQLTGDHRLLDEAVRQCRRAVELTNPGHLLYPRMQANLGAVLSLRHESAATGDDGDLGAAAEVAMAAFAATPEGHPNRAERGLLLGNLLWSRYLADRDPAVLDEIIQIATIAAEAAPPGHHQWAAASELLARARAVRGHSGGGADLTAAAALFGEIAGNASVPASTRVAASWQRAAPLQALGDQAGALRAAVAAVGMLPQVAPRNLMRADQERPLAAFHGLASGAAALAIDAGDPELALALLEQGRGILLRQAVENRTDLTALKEREPALAAEFERLRDLLDPASAANLPGDLPAPSPAHAGLAAERRDALTAEWDGLIGRIRSVPGFTGFLRPPTAAELAARCTGGHVAIINVSSLFRSDALILGPDGVRVVPLPGLRFEDAAARAQAFQPDVSAAWASGAAAGRVAGTLGWLWDVIAAPVLDAIGVTGPPATGAPWPRLWWVPTGPLAFLPLHAAGRRPAAGAVLDRVISSYLPTVRSLPAPGTAAAGQPTALAVAMRQTPGMGDLSTAEEEAAHVAARVPGTTVLKGAEATSAAVRDLLPGHAWAHFACHAVSSPADAAGAQLLLHDHQDRQLTVRDIAALRNDRAELAYLSACDTAHGPARLADEAIHLTGTFHLAGYSHVIGTLWSIADPVAAAVARSVYDDITTPAPDAGKTAEALHKAIRELRDADPDAPAIWAAHIHVGP